MPTLEITIKRPRFVEPEGTVSRAILRERHGKSGRKVTERLELPGLGSAGALAFDAIRTAAKEILRDTAENGTPPRFVVTRR